MKKRRFVLHGFFLMFAMSETSLAGETNQVEAIAGFLRQPAPEVVLRVENILVSIERLESCPFQETFESDTPWKEAIHEASRRSKKLMRGNPDFWAKDMYRRSNQEVWDRYKGLTEFNIEFGQDPIVGLAKYLNLYSRYEPVQQLPYVSIEATLEVLDGLHEKITILQNYCEI